MFEMFKAGGGLPQDIRIEGESTFIRPPADYDWADWAQLRERSRGFLVPWEPTWPADCLTRGAFRRRLRHYAEEWHSGIGYAFFIFSRHDQTLQGGITLSNVRRGVAQTGTLGYWVGEPFARRGVMTQGIRCTLHFAFIHLRLHRVEAACLPRNTASRGVLEKLGFREEGYARRYLRINGTWEDHVLYGMIENDPAAAAAIRGIAETQYE